MGKDTANIIEAAEEDYLYIMTSQLPNAGNGLFTAINIYKDEIISIFKGELLKTSEAAIRVKNNQDQYFINLPDGKIMDSMHTDCFAKYANDAKGYSGSFFKNNAKITLSDEGLICLTSTKRIKAGEEIFCDYGKKYWKKHGK